jgi:hypothetical protein
VCLSHATLQYAAARVRLARQMELADNDNNSNGNSDAHNSSAHGGALGQSTTSVDGSDSGFFDAQQSITKDVSIHTVIVRHAQACMLTLLAISSSWQMMYANCTASHCQ